MPYTNRVKSYKSGGVYHIYARGINKCKMYKDSSDYFFFKYLLKKYLSDGFKEKKILNNEEIYVPVNTVFSQVQLTAYSLMPNHFHLLLKNIEKDGITNLMKRVLSVYVGYFNRKYEREGTLIQGNYRSVHITNDLLYIYVSRYIHTNSLKDGLVAKLIDYPYCSYKNYLYNKSTSWLVIDDILLKATDYKNIESYIKDVVPDMKSGIL